MKTLGKFHCWLVRLGGGKHKEKRVRGDARDTAHAYGYSFVCQRCEAVRMPVVKRVGKAEEVKQP